MTSNPCSIRLRAGRRFRRGMTLLEVMVAAGITSVAFILAMGSFVSISSTGSISEGQAMATATVSSVLEELRGLPYEEMLAYQLPSTGVTGGATVSVVCFDASDSSYSLPLSDSQMDQTWPNPLKVQVTVVWRDNMGRFLSARGTSLIGR